MTTATDTPSFTLPERALLRQEFFVRVGQAPLLANGIRLRSWRTGPHAGQPKLPPAVASMIARGLVTLQSDRVGASAQFTETGYAALRLLAQDRRALNPPHLRPSAPGARAGVDAGRGSATSTGSGIRLWARLLAVVLSPATRMSSPLPRIRAAKPGIGRKWPAIAAKVVSASAPTGMQLYTAASARKYLTASERDGFLRAAERANRLVRTLCMTLAYGSCRLSEALALSVDRVDLAAGVLMFESLKKCRDGIYRSVPVPPALLETLNMVHGIRELQGQRGKGRGVRLWPWSRMTGWRAVHAVMRSAGLDGVHASPKGLRHGFGVSAGILLNMVQKWLGHAQLSTTAIYANAVGTEEKDIASRMWT